MLHGLDTFCDIIHCKLCKYCAEIVQMTFNLSGIWIGSALVSMKKIEFVPEIKTINLCQSFFFLQKLKK